MSSAPPFGRLSASMWAPCPVAPPAEALDASRALQRDVREVLDTDRGVIRLYVGPEMSDVEPDRKLAAS